ncbi:hypothetical protein [Magnetospirillum sulfuroxidans]|uniref:hypothetical protein n=1 Tax=Magnetospirillum sulfuroxidans TaxID=611300 RepID=UPI0020129ED7|nr:hypothetical protein [Magnetospirillum sulfuroxidans]
MKAIKALVAFMGVLLVGGLALLGWGLYSQAGKITTKPTRSSVAADDFGAISVPLPAGSRIDQVLVVSDRLVLRVIGGGPERLVVLDPASGAITGSFVATPEAPVPR